MGPGGRPWEEATDTNSAGLAGPAIVYENGALVVMSLPPIAATSVLGCGRDELMPDDKPAVPAILIDCIGEARAPTVFELDELAAQIWTDGGADRSAFSWARLEPGSTDRVTALRLAIAAMSGC